MSTQDSRRKKENIELCKIPKFGVNWFDNELFIAVPIWLNLLNFTSCVALARKWIHQL